MKILNLFISDGHNYVGHHGQPPGTHSIQETDQIECVAGKGIRGDRYFEHKDNFKGQITFLPTKYIEFFSPNSGSRIYCLLRFGET